MDFEWDAIKARRNRKKHGVSFAAAADVFSDLFAAIFADLDHSDAEDRELIIGHSKQNRLLVVCFTQRGENVRIIIARAATKRERRDYEESPKRQ